MTLIITENQALKMCQVTLREAGINKENEAMIQFNLLMELLNIIEVGIKHKSMISTLGYNECPKKLKEDEVQIQTELIFRNNIDLKMFKSSLNIK